MTYNTMNGYVVAIEDRGSTVVITITDRQGVEVEKVTICVPEIEGD